MCLSNWNITYTLLSHSWQLYEALHVGEHQVKKERELNGKLEELNEKLGPLEMVRSAARK